MSTNSLIDETIEQKVQKKLIERFVKFYGDRVEGHVNALLSLESHKGRFAYLQNKIGNQLFSSQYAVLISGFSVGSEMIAAKQLGFGEVFGVEVNPFYQEMCQERVGHISGIHPQLYDGYHLPYESELFGVVASSHVIEHTQSPELYIQECIRVLIPEGYLLLEFPHRYHPIELHTGVVSFEWLPRPLRNLVLKVLSARYFPLESKKKKLYKQILTTNLQQISMGGIENILRKLAISYAVVDKLEWRPGIIRCIIKKTVSTQIATTNRFTGQFQKILWRLKMDTYEHRKSILKSCVDIRNYSGLEIGPLDKPLVTKKDGPIKYLDYMSKEELIARHASASNPKNMVDVDYIYNPLDELPNLIDEEFDYVIACHVIEHIPNMIGWLNDVHKILKDNGYLYLAIPDKRYTFDIARPVTTLSHFLNDYHQNVKTADFAHVFDHIYLKRNITAGDVWNNKVQDKINVERFTARDAYRRTMHELEPGKYPDVHCHVFTSLDFLNIINTLIDLDLLAYTVHSFEDVRRPYNEFLVILQKTET